MAEASVKIPPPPLANLFYNQGEITPDCFISVIKSHLYCIKRMRKRPPRHAWEGKVIFAEPIQAPETLNRGVYLSEWAKRNNIRLIYRPEIPGADVYYLEQLEQK